MMIQLERVTKLYKTVIGVNDLDVSLPMGSYGLVGPNGSGKTTLLRLLTGQLRPTLGKVQVLGKTPWNNSPLFRQIGYCPQEEPFSHQVSALEWVSFLLQMYGFGPRSARQMAEQSLEQVGLAEVQHRLIATYSRGMRQRVKLAQALAHDPQFLILDEPFSGLDPMGRHQMIQLLRERVRAGKGLLLATHLLHDVEAVADAFLLICGGRLLASGKAEEVFALLEELPKEIFLRTPAPRQLAQLLLENPWVESVRILSEDRVWIASRNSAQLFQTLPRLIDQGNISVWELSSSDSSLQSLFDILLKIHYGLMPHESKGHKE